MDGSDDDVGGPVGDPAGAPADGERRRAGGADVAARPRIALAMMDGMLGYGLRPEHLDRLAEIGELVDPEPLTTFDDERAAAVLADADVLVGHWGCPTLTAAALAKAPHLRLFAYAAGTVKWQVTDAVFERGVVVTSAASANAVPVAEYTVGVILLVNKGVFLFAAIERDPDAVVPLDPVRVGNVGKRIGLVGASHVGRHVIELLRPYRLEVAVADPYLSTEEAERLGVTKMRLDELCSWCDVLSLHAPDIEATRGMVGRTQLGRLRDGATVVNTARGALIDQDALTEELVAGRLAAVLDVSVPEPLPPDSVLRRLPNVVLTPHVAGAVGREVDRLADLAVDEVRRYATGEPPRFPVRREDLDRIA
ncbi:MAG: hydroxyacid dehydrogenase [Acidimicrobiales bacterium]